MARLRTLLLSIVVGCTPPKAVTPPPAVAPEFAPNRHIRTPLLGAENLDGTRRARVLFYGQSITQSSWSRATAAWLHARYPHAEIENRAIGGFASPLLVKTAEADLYPYYPDLVIFHVYGAHDAYEDLVRRIRERTTADVLLQTDHVLLDADLDEETSPSALAPREEMWSAFMNHAFLPGLVAKYRVALCDVREAWKQEIRSFHERPKELLLDGLHLNARGDALMSAAVESCLTSERARAADDRVRDYPIAPVQGGTLEFVFEGNRIDALVDGEVALDVAIDGKRPSEHPELYAFSRATSPEIGMWPPLLKLSSQAPVIDQYRLALTRAPGLDAYAFELRGSRTGAQGSGRTDQPFASTSGAVRIDPGDWNIAYAFALAKKAPLDTFTIDVRIEPHFADRIVRQGEVALAQGLSNAQHTLTLRGNDFTALRALRVYRPPLGRSLGVNTR